MAASPIRLGIDFGTTRTVVSAAQDGRYPVVTFDGAAGYVDFLPGLCVQRGDDLLFGDDARAALAVGESRGMVRSIKRSITGLGADDLVAGLHGVSALDVTTAYLTWLRRVLVERSNLEIDADAELLATVAVPANATTGQRYLTLEAFRRAGFAPQAMIGEPTAAAIEYAHNHRAVIGARSPKRYVIVYDLGGGTFDTAAVSLEGRRFTLIASEGIARLGGEDFDAVVLDMALEALGVDAPALDGHARMLALEAARQAKETLTSASRRLVVDLAAALPGSEPVLLDTAALYERSQPLVDRSLAMTQRLFDALPAHGIDPESKSELGGLYLVGGGVAFPAVARALRKVYARKIQLAPHPHAATAIGLAIAGDPDAGIFVREATTRHFGVWREADAGRRQIFDPIFSKDALAGQSAMVVRRGYRPCHTIGELRFLECSALAADGQPEGDVTPWQVIRFPYDPDLLESTGNEDLADLTPERRRGLERQQIVETYTYGDDGTIAVAIENQTGGYRRDFVLGAMPAS